jgi:hypothetical protein
MRLMARSPWLPKMMKTVMRTTTPVLRMMLRMKMMSDLMGA